MRYLTLEEVLVLYKRVMDVSGGLSGVRDYSILESAVAQPFDACPQQTPTGPSLRYSRNV